MIWRQKGAIRGDATKPGDGLTCSHEACSVSARSARQNGGSGDRSASAASISVQQKLLRTLTVPATVPLKLRIDQVHLGASPPVNADRALTHGSQARTRKKRAKNSPQWETTDMVGADRTCWIDEFSPSVSHKSGEARLSRPSTSLRSRSPTPTR